METRIVLEQYVRKYYDHWLGCSHRWCSMLGIPGEAYDLFADALLDLCQKPEAKLRDLVEHEERGDRKLFFYVRRMIRLSVYEYKVRKAHRCYLTECPPEPLQNPEIAEIPEDLFNQFREVTAVMRADDFVNLKEQYTGAGRIYRFVTCLKRPSGVVCTVKYEACSTTGQRRQYVHRSRAVAFLAQQNTPPRKLRTTIH